MISAGDDCSDDDAEEVVFVAWYVLGLDDARWMNDGDLLLLCVAKTTPGDAYRSEWRWVKRRYELMLCMGTGATSL